MKGNKFATILALGGVPFIMVLGNSMLIPVLPEIKEALNLSQFEVSLIITLFSIPAGLAIPFAGFLSDRFGRKIVIIPSLILYGLGGVVAGLAALLLKNSYYVILGGRILQGIGAAGTAPVAMALCGDIFTGKERGKALGSIEASNGMGKVVSPILGALIGLIAWYATFWVFPALTVLIAIGVWFLVKEPNTAGNQQKVGQYVSSVKKIFLNKAGLLSTTFLAGSLVLLLLFGVLFYLSDFLETTHKIFGVRKGLVLAIPVLAMSSTSLITGNFIQKKVKLMKILIILGLAIISLSMASLPFAKSLYYFVGIMAVAGMGVGLVLPCINTLITSSCSIDERGMVTSLYGGVRFFGVAIGPPLFGALMEVSPSFMFWVSAGAVLPVILMSIFLVPAKAPDKGQSPIGRLQAVPARKKIPEN